MDERKLRMKVLKGEMREKDINGIAEIRGIYDSKESY